MKKLIFLLVCVFLLLPMSAETRTDPKKDDAKKEDVSKKAEVKSGWQPVGSESKTVDKKTIPSGERATRKPVVANKTNPQDTNACNYARKVQTDRTWILYLEKFPNGICVNEAKKALDKIACEKVKNLDPLAGQKASKISLEFVPTKKIEAWKSYLQDFPKGQCVKEANNKICELANTANSLTVWKKYLKDFPKGQCAEDANKKICDLTRNLKSRVAWEQYLKDFPDGLCAFEAEDEIKRLQECDDKACKDARSQNSIQSWKNYLQNFPDGKCKDEASSIIKRKEKEEHDRAEKERKDKERKDKERKDIASRTFGNLVCSKRSPNTMSWYDAKKYCQNLREDDSNEWRLPNSFELKELLKHSVKSKFGDEGWFWSSTDSGSTAYDLKFNSSNSQYSNKTDNDFVRCVRKLPAITKITVISKDGDVCPIVN